LADAMNSLSAIILAAGKGTRMQSDLPKVAHQVAGKPMVRWVADACAAAGCTRIAVVVGYQQSTVRACLDGFAGAELTYVEQTEQLGTGHAVMVCRDAFQTEASQPGHHAFVLAGDGPLIRDDTLATLRDRHLAAEAAASLATARIDDPEGYGRIVRDDAGRFVRIVEDKNATDQQRAIDEVNPSYYCFHLAELFPALDAVEKNPVSGEYYITDVPAILLDRGRRVEVIDAVPTEDVLSINTPEQLAEVDAILRARLDFEADMALPGGD
jgi:UDP-N-acetylglucosamine diphosphorylase/glucosamine-1-phosphate N-acetyltransferase